jgi:hypothetical protein
LQQLNNSPPRFQQIPKSVPAQREQRSSVDIFRPDKTDSNHPFGRELEQLDEIAEEFGGTLRDAEREADLDAMRRRGLVKWSANDYILEIRPLFSKCYEEPRLPQWI